jgi:hypothetical protein
MSEPERVFEWYLPLTEFSYTGDQRNSVGAPFRFGLKSAGLSLERDCVVTDCVENEAFAFRFTPGGRLRSYEESWRIEPIVSGCRFTSLEEWNLRLGLLGSLLAPIVARLSGAAVDRILRHLKTLAEV